MAGLIADFTVKDVSMKPLEILTHRITFLRGFIVADATVARTLVRLHAAPPCGIVNESQNRIATRVGGER